MLLSNSIIYYSRLSEMIIHWRNILEKTILFNLHKINKEKRYTILKNFY